MDATYDLSDLTELAVGCHQRLLAHQANVGVAESLTGGLLAATLTEIPGASASFAGGIVAYTVAAKRELVGVAADLLDRYGPVHPETVEAMARGAARVLGATYGVATTGVAGPEAHGGHPAGTVFVACAGPNEPRVAKIRIDGDRRRVRAMTAGYTLRMLHRMLDAP